MFKCKYCDRFGQRLSTSIFFPVRMGFLLFEKERHASLKIHISQNFVYENAIQIISGCLKIFAL